MAEAAATLGKLAKFPLAEILVELLAQRASGSLVLTEPSGRRAVLSLQNGVVAKARTLAILGDTLSPVEAISRHIEWAAERSGNTTFEFFEHLDILPEGPPVVSPPLAQIWRSACQVTHPARVDRLLERLARCPLRLHPRARLDLFAFDWDELACLEPLRSGPLSLTQLLAPPRPDPRILRRLIYLLAICHHLDTGDGREPVGVGWPGAEVQPSHPIRPSRKQLDHAASSGQLRAQSGLVRRAHTTEPNARTPSIHPQRLSRNVPREYSRSGLAPQAALRRAEELERSQEFAQALPLVEMAAVKRKGDPTCSALLAYLRVRCGRFNDRRAEQDLDSCHRAVREHPDSVRFRYYRAWLLRAMGREEESLRDFEQVVRSQPNHIDAARELFRHRRERQQIAR